MSIETALVSAIESLRGAAAADRLCEACVTVLEVDAAAISLILGGSNVGTLGASSQRAREYDELQFTIGRGPGLESVTTRAPVLVPDLAADVSSGRWPAYAAALVKRRVGAVFSFPVVMAGQYFGALDLFRHHSAPLSADGLSHALVAAELAAMPMLDLLDTDREDSTGGPTTSGLTDLDKVTRAEVSQATGMLIAQLDVGPAEALVRLRAHAYATDQSVTEVARAVLDRRLRLEPS